MLKTPSWRTASLVMALTAMMGLALPALGDDGHPFRGYYVHGGTITEAKPVCDGLLVTTTGSGQATHLGRFTRLGMVVVDADGRVWGTPCSPPPMAINFSWRSWVTRRIRMPLPP